MISYTKIPGIDKKIMNSRLRMIMKGSRVLDLISRNTHNIRPNQSARKKAMAKDKT